MWAPTVQHWEPAADVILAANTKEEYDAMLISSGEEGDMQLGDALRAAMVTTAPPSTPPSLAHV